MAGKIQAVFRQTPGKLCPIPGFGFGVFQPSDPVVKTVAGATFKFKVVDTIEQPYNIEANQAHCRKQNRHQTGREKHSGSPDSKNRFKPTPVEERQLAKSSQNDEGEEHADDNFARQWSAIHDRADHDSARQEQDNEKRFPGFNQGEKHTEQSQGRKKERHAKKQIRAAKDQPQRERYTGRDGDRDQKREKYKCQNEQYDSPVTRLKTV